MANIRKQPGKRSKPWRVQIRRKAGHIDKCFRTKKEAVAFAVEVESDLSHWAKLLGGELRRHTLAELIDRHVEHWTGKDRTTPSRLAWWREHYGERRLNEVDADMVREALARLEDGLSNASVNRYQSALSGCYREAVDRGWLGVRDNPVRGIRARKETSRFGRCLTDDERIALLDACDRSRWPRLGLFVRMALGTGCRRGELVKLEWRDVDRKRGTVLLRDTKNDDDRVVPLIPDLLARLDTAAKVRRLDDPRVFPGSRPTYAAPIERAWQAARAEAGIEDLRFHDLRHSCGTFLARAGCTAFQIAAILGHRSGPGLTARYVHLAGEDTRELMEGALCDVLSE